MTDKQSKTSENAWETLGYAKPDLIKVNEEGHEEWFWMVHMAGVDENGVYEVCLDGPAQGEKSYV